MQISKHTQHTANGWRSIKSVLSCVDNNMNWFADLQHFMSVVEASHAMQTNINDVTTTAATATATTAVAAAAVTMALRKRACSYLAKAAATAAYDDEWINALAVSVWMFVKRCVRECM